MSSISPKPVSDMMRKEQAGDGIVVVVVVVAVVQLIVPCEGT